MSEQRDHCPHLGLKQNRAIRFASPTPEHRCYVTGESQEIPVDQTGYCLSPNHVNCPLYMGLDVPSTSRIVRDTSHFPQGGLRGWIYSLSPRDQVIYGALIAVLVVVFLVYGILAIQILFPPQPSNGSPARGTMTLPTSTTPAQIQAPSTPAEPASDQMETATETVPGIHPTTNLIKDGGFEEADLPGTAWVTTNAGAPPICRETINACTNGYTGSSAFKGNAWVWFGRSDSQGTSSVSQAIRIPAGRANLTFWLRVPHTSGTGNDFLQVSMNDDAIFRVSDEDVSRYDGEEYQAVSLDVSGYADDQLHTLEFLADIENSNGAMTSFFLDEISLVVTPNRPTASPATSIANPTDAPTSTPVSPAPQPTSPSSTRTVSPAPAEPGDTTSNYLILYMLDSTGTVLIPISRPAADTPIQQQMEAAVRELIAGPAPGSGLVGPIPPGTTVLSISRDGGTLTVDFDRQPGNDQALTAIALTLTEFPGIHEVQIQVNGRAVGVEGGSLPIKRPSVNADNPDNLPEAFSSRKTSFLPLYFQYNGYYVRITRLVPNTKTPVKATIEELLKGPGDGYENVLTTPIPPDTQLRSVNANIEEGRVVVDLTQAFIDAPDPDAALNALVFSLTELRDSDGQRLFQEVEVLIEGSSILDSSWGDEYDRTFQRPVLNQEA